MILCNCRILLRASPVVDTNAAHDSLSSNSLAIARWRSKSTSSDLVAARASPSIAFTTLANNELVNPPIADTTITGRELTANFTIAHTLRMAVASSTEVPPNFMMVGFIKTFGVRRLDAAVQQRCLTTIRRLNALRGQFKAATSRRTPQQASRREYDWSNDSAKPSRHKTLTQVSSTQRLFIR